MLPNYNEERTAGNWANKSGFDASTLNTQWEVYSSEIIETTAAIVTENFQEIVDGAVDIDWMAQMLKHLSGIDVSHQVEEVHTLIKSAWPGLLEENYLPFKDAVLASNYSKFCYSEEEVLETIEKYKALGVVVDGFLVGDIYVIRCTETSVGTDGKKYHEGKLLKGIHYHEPNYVVQY